jgi:drug/metabolite transporter (DMT)-like permease
MLLRAALLPGTFVLLWSTGFIGAKLGLPHAESATFLLLRYALAALVLGGIALAQRSAWPRDSAEIAHIVVAGLLLHFVYIGGVFAAIERGLPAGVSALIVSLQPLLTAVVARPLLGERIGPRQWLGFLLGLAGAALVVAEKLRLGSGDSWAVALSVAALLGITAGTLYQKRFLSHMDLRSGTALQYLACALAFAPCALAFETMHLEWTAAFAVALVWLVVVLSVGAVSLLFVLLRRGEAARTAALFYLVPPCTAVVAFLLFGETLGPVALGGMAVSVLGVALAMRAPAHRTAES